MTSADTATEPVAAELGYLRACIEAAQAAPEAFDLPVLLPRIGAAVAAVEAVLEVAAKAERGCLRWEDPLPVPEWVPRVREAISAALLRGDT